MKYLNLLKVSKLEVKGDKSIYYYGDNPNHPTIKFFNLKKMKIEN